MSISELLDMLQERASVGQLVSIAVAIVQEDGCTASCWVMEDGETLAELMGSVALLQHKLSLQGIDGEPRRTH